MGNDEVAFMAFIDFKKAFDLIDHQVLLTKLQSYRVGDSAMKWFTSYITGSRNLWPLMDSSQVACLLITVCRRVQYWVLYCSFYI